MVLAVIAAVGIFGAQTSDQTEAASTIHATLNSGNGVPNINVVVGRTYTIDLSQYVTTPDTDTASATYHLIAEDLFDFDDLPAYGYPANDSAQAGATTRLRPAFRASNSACTAAAATCDSPPAIQVVSLNENTGLLTLKINGDFSAGAYLQWVADSTPANNDPLNPGATAGTPPVQVYDTYAASGTDDARTDTFLIVSRDAPQSGDTPGRGTASDTPPDGFFPTAANEDDSTPYARPSWRSAEDDASIFAGFASSTATTAAATGQPVVWELADLPTTPHAYALVGHSSDESVAEVSTSGTTVTVIPKSQGTTTITVDVIDALLAAVDGSTTLASRTATTDKWRIQNTFTVNYASEAPPIEIYRDINRNGKDSDDPRGNTKSAPIGIPVASGTSGEIARLRTDSSEDATYQNRNIFWGLAAANGADVVRNFRVSQGGISNNVDLGQDDAVGGTGVNRDVTTQVSTGILSIAPGVTLPAESTYTIQVTADDTAPGGTIDNAYITVTIIQGNRAPTLTTPAEITVPESPGTAVGAMILDLDLLSSDPDGQNITFGLVDKTGATPAENLVSGGKFTIHAATNELRLAEAINYEDVDDDGDIAEEDTAEERTTLGFDRDAVRWRGTITATDGLVTTERKIAIKVGDGPEAAVVTPTIGLVFSIDENNDAGAEVGTVRIPASSAAGADDLTANYRLDPNADGGDKFAISGAGLLTVTDAGALDYETQSTYLLVALAAATEGGTEQLRPVTVNINDVNEAPVFTQGDTPAPASTATPTPLSATDVYVARVSESADVGDAVAYGYRTDDPPLDSTFEVKRGVTDDDTKDDTPPGVAGKLTYSLVAAQTTAGNPITSPEVAFSGPFAINASTGAITVSARLDAETTASYPLHVKVTDNDATDAKSDTVKLTITILGENEPPYFVTGRGSTTAVTDVDPITINENTASGTTVATYYAVDPDGDDITFVLRAARDADFFTIDGETGVLTVAAGKTLDYEEKASYELELEVIDNAAGQGQILQVINLRNLNDNSPVWQQTHTSLSVDENVLRGSPLTGTGGVTSTYTATDRDGDTITYTVGGANGRSYQIGSSSGMLTTLASLDAETNPSDVITVTASDGTNSITQNTRITIADVNDRIGSITVKMANPVLGTNGDPNSALADRKETEALAAPEAPGDLPVATGDTVVNFVETAAAGWGTVLRIEVLSESPGLTCGSGNQCVVIELEGDDSDDILKVMAYRNKLKDNLFVAAVMPVQNANMATPGDAAVYKHTDGSVPRIRVDEEDTLRIKFGNLRDSVTIDNEAPEFSNFLPEHEASTDDDEVQYTFTVTDAIAGIPDPEDLPDVDGDDSYMAVAALVNSQQCHNVAAGVTPPSGTSMVANTNLHEGAQIYCPSGTTPEVRVIVDDKDLDSVTDGYEVDTEIVLSSNQISFVTFVACDAAGNCVAFDPDENDTTEALAEITVDTIAPDLSQARTGVMWDSANNEYDDSRSFIQAIFTDLSKLNPDTIEADDFVVDGYTIKRVYWYDDPDTEDQNWGTRFDTGSGSRAYREISKTVFIELEEELLPDATPDVSVVPNGLEDEAGKEQDDDEVEADDWIAPKFAVQSITSPLETSRDNVLAGEDDKVVLNVTSDERISTTKPLVDVHYVNAPAGCVDRAGIILRAGRDTDGDGRVEPSEARADCAESARGGTINSVISKDGTNEWTITVDKPSSTGYYNVYIYADDRSSQNNRGSEGVAPADIGTKFFEKDGDVNADDAVFFEGDVQLPKPQVVVSGEDAGDTEPTVEFKRPLFIEVDFTEPFSADCSAGDKLSNKLECTAETAEYAQDGFDAVTITRFELNGVDMTDDVKTTDDETFLVALDDVGIGDHELKIQATDLAGNELKDVLEIEFEVEERDPFTRRLNPGWNLVSLPGSPADSAIASVFGSDIEVRTVYTYNPVTPGGWQVAVRETLDDAWQGDLTDITAKSGYWVLSDAIQDLEVSIPRLAGGAVGASTPVQPPVIPMYAGWNLIPVVDVTGDALDTKKSINATTYLNSLDDGLDLARVLGFNTITNEWFTVIDPSDASVTDNLQIGSAYWVFVRESASLVPGGIPR